MERAKPTVLRNALQVAHEYVRAGITFVCVPVDTDEQHVEATVMASRNLNSMIKDAEDEE